jgi:hypothetical protein
MCAQDLGSILDRADAAFDDYDDESCVDLYTEALGIDDSIAHKLRLCSDEHNPVRGKQHA